jgi:uncharacterized membrane protein YdjX (TVP38/TMEM64 family)
VPRLPRTAILFGLVSLAVIGSKVLIENILGLDLGRAVSAWAAAPGVGAATVVIGLLAVDILLPVPSSVVMMASGALFGVGWGAVWSLAGSIGGEWLGFELVRRYGPRAARRLVSDDELQRLGRIMDQHGAAAIVVSRAVPVMMETLSVIAGLSRMPRATFLGASLLGTIPIVIVYAWAGARARDTGSLVPAIVITVAVAAGGWIWFRSRPAR